MKIPGKARAIERGEVALKVKHALEADTTLPEWLYAKMVSGYSPLVPTVGILSIATSAVLLIIALTVPWLIRKHQEKRTR